MNSVETNWYVLTGGPCSGKSTTLEYLSSRGYLVVPEMARVVIDEEISLGQTIEQIRADEFEFQARILGRKMQLERELLVERVTLFDRGIPDTIAYYRKLSMSIPSILLSPPERRYKLVFFMEQLPFKKDYGRVENEEDALKLSAMLYMAYTECGYDLVSVPVMSLEARAQSILDRIKS